MLRKPGQAVKANHHRRCNFCWPVGPNRPRRLHGRPQPHATHRRRWCFVRRLDRGSIPAPHQRCEIQQARLGQVHRNDPDLRRNGGTRCPRPLSRNSARGLITLAHDSQAQRPLPGDNWFVRWCESCTATCRASSRKVRGLIKLNTNENPAPPSPKVIRAIRSAADERLRRLPRPGRAHRCARLLAKFHGCKPENIIVGNGSDELLALATRAFVEPRQAGATTKRQVAKQTIQYFTPSYSLYPILADIHGARRNEVKLPASFELPDE